MVVAEVRDREAGFAEANQVPKVVPTRVAASILGWRLDVDASAFSAPPIDRIEVIEVEGDYDA